jgi:hypothetical protein
MRAASSTIRPHPVSHRLRETWKFNPKSNEAVLTLNIDSDKKKVVDLYKTLYFQRLKLKIFPCLMNQLKNF